MALTNVYGVNYKKAFDPSVAVHTLIPQGEQSGVLKVAYDSILLDNVAFALTDIVYMMKLPKGAKIIDAILKCPDLNTLGALNVGFSGGAELFSAVDVSGQAVATHIAAGISAHLSTLTEEKQVTIKPSAATTDATVGSKIELVVLYVVV